MGISRAQLLSDRNARHCAAANCSFWTLKRSTMSSHFNRTHVKTPAEIEKRLMAHKVNMGLMKFVDKNFHTLKTKCIRSPKSPWRMKGYSWKINSR